MLAIVQLAGEPLFQGFHTVENVVDAFHEGVLGLALRNFEARVEDARWRGVFGVDAGERLGRYETT
ncbi:hypothetical protein JCM15519_11450 [Fundidesulfovibrio butyratiphilus]